jgi:hypothetical protein
MSVAKRQRRKMQIKSAIDGSILFELQLEGVVEMDPVDARSFMNALRAPQLQAHLVFKIGKTGTWYRADSGRSVSLTDHLCPHVNRFIATGGNYGSRS